MMRTIKSYQIQSIEDLAPGHPVFLLTFLPDRAVAPRADRNGRGGGLQKVPLQAFPDATREQQLVIKGEIIRGEGEEAGCFSRARYKAIADVMKQVSGRVESEVLTESEVHELRVATGLTTELLKKVLGWSGDYFLVKMKFFDNVNMISRTYDAFKDKEIEVLNNLFKELRRNRRAWESLGELVAADFFAGNRDRISLELEEREFFFGNPGNVFFKLNKKGLVKKALALDNFDPNATDVGNLLSEDVELWFKECGVVLKAADLYPQFAGRVVRLVVEHFEKAGVSVIPYGFKDEEKYFLDGFLRGIDKLKIYVWANSSNQGLIARARRLGWAPMNWHGSVRGDAPGDRFISSQREKKN